MKRFKGPKKHHFTHSLTHSLHFTHKNCPSNPLRRTDTFVPILKKIVLHRGILIFVRSTLQFVQTLKPTRQLLCTFSSCSDLGIYIIYNIYKFQENPKTKKGSLLSRIVSRIVSRKVSRTVSRTVSRIVSRKVSRIVSRKVSRQFAN